MSIVPFPPREPGPDAWRDQLIVGRDGAKACRENVLIVLREHPQWQGVLAADTFARRIVCRRASPLGQKPGAEWTEDDDIEFGLWLGQQVGFTISNLDHIRAAVGLVAREAPYCPPLEWLQGLTWDDTERVDTWLSTYLGVAPAAYAALVGRFFLINLIRRIFEPGCIMRSVMVLEGPQNKGKSEALRTVAAPWFSDTPFRVGDKDAYLQIQGTLLYEISELESFSRAEATAVKAFISSRDDNFRAPYERTAARHPRMVSFAGTTNAVEYLKDWSGNTRFWPVATGARIDLEALARDRDQLLAEAMSLYLQGEVAYPTPEQQAEHFEAEQEMRRISHPWLDWIGSKLDGEWIATREVTVHEVMTDMLRLDMTRISPQGSEAQRVGQALAQLGWVKSRPRKSGGKRQNVWLRPIAASPPKLEGNDDPVPF